MRKLNSGISSGLIKKVSELKDTIDLSSPLGAFTASAYMQVKGNDSVCFDKIYTFRFCPLGKSYQTVKYDQK